MKKIHMFAALLAMLLPTVLWAGGDSTTYYAALKAQVSSNSSGMGKVYAGTSNSAPSASSYNASSSQTSAQESETQNSTKNLYAFALPNEGYEFVGWSKSNNGSDLGKGTAVGDAYRITASVTFNSESSPNAQTWYATFKEKVLDAFSITFEASANGTYTVDGSAPANKTGLTKATSVILASSDSNFLNWNINGTVINSNPYTLSCTANTTVGADFLTADQVTSVTTISELTAALSNAAYKKIIVPSGTTLTVANGSTVNVPEDKSLVVDGTLCVEGALTANGKVSVNGTGTMSKCTYAFVQEGVSGEPVNPYEGVRYWRTKTETVSASISGVTGAKSHVKITNGKGFVSRYIFTTSSPAMLVCNVDSTMAINHITGVKGEYASSAFTTAASSSTSQMILLLSDLTFNPDKNNKYTSDAGILDCAGKKFKLSGYARGGYKHIILNGAAEWSQGSSSGGFYGKCKCINCSSVTIANVQNAGANWIEFYDCTPSKFITAMEDKTSTTFKVRYYSGGPYATSTFTGVEGCYELYGGCYTTEPKSTLIAPEKSGTHEFRQNPTDNYWYLMLKGEDVAQVGNVKYKSFDEAFTAAMKLDSATITILKSTTVDKSYTIDLEKSLCIEFAGCKIVSTAEGAFLKNYGTLELGDKFGNFDTAGIEAETILENHGTVDVCYGAYTGNISLSGGTFTTHHGLFDGSLTIDDGLDAQTVANIRGGVFTSSVANYLRDGIVQNYYQKGTEPKRYWVGRFPQSITNETSITGMEKAWSLDFLSAKNLRLYKNASTERSAYEGAEWQEKAELSASLQAYLNYVLDCSIGFDVAVTKETVTIYAPYVNAKKLDKNLLANERYSLVVPSFGDGYTPWTFDDYIANVGTSQCGVADGSDKRNTGAVFDVRVQLCDWNKNVNDQQVTKVHADIAICRYMLGGKKAAIDRDGSRLAYDSLSAAVSAANDGERILVGANTAENVTLPGAGTFTIDPYGFSFTGTVGIPSTCFLKSQTEVASSATAQGVASANAVTYVVAQKVASVGETFYDNLNEAVAAANGAVVMLLAATDETITLMAEGQSFTLNKNGVEFDDAKVVTTIENGSVAVSDGESVTVYTAVTSVLEASDGNTYTSVTAAVTDIDDSEISVTVTANVTEEVELPQGKALVVTAVPGVTVNLTVEPADGAFLVESEVEGGTKYESKKITVEMTEPQAAVAVTKIENGEETTVSDPATITAAVNALMSNVDVPRTDNTDKLDVLDKITVTPSTIVQEVVGANTFIRSATFDVTPTLNVGQSLGVGQKLKFRLPVDSAVAQLCAMVYHNGAFFGTVPVSSETVGATTYKFLEVESDDFSPYGYTILDGETANPVAVIGTTGYASLAAAAAAAQSGDTIVVIADISGEAVEVPTSVTITSDDAANPRTLSNVSINATGSDISLTVKDLAFTGNSWINSANGGELTVENVTADVSPSNGTAVNSRSAFIGLGRDESKTLALTVKDSTIVVPSGTDAILGWAKITEASIEGTTIGSATKKINSGDAVKIMGVASGATITFVGNTVYSDWNGIAIEPNTSRDNDYTAIFEKNTFVGDADHIWFDAQGSTVSHATVLATSDNTVNGVALTPANIANNDSTWTSFAGVDVVTNEAGKVTAGTFTSFSSTDAVEAALAEDYKYVTSSGTYVVTPKVYVAQIGDVKYETFAEAIAAAEAYKTANGDYPVITVLDATAEQTNPDWKIADGKLVHKVYVAQNTTTGVKYESLAAAVAGASAGNTITMLADDRVSLTSGQEIEINKPLTITGPVDGDGKPLYTIYGTPSNTGYNDVFVASSSGTVTISNLAFAEFGNEAASSVNGHAPIFVSSGNNNVVLENLVIGDFNRTAIKINGGEFLVKDCYIDCDTDVTNYRVGGIDIANAATGSIVGTTIVNVDTSDPTEWVAAALELIGSGDILVEDCSITSSMYGIFVSTADGTSPGSSAVTVVNTTVEADMYSLINDSDSTDAEIAVESGSYTGLLYAETETGLAISGGSFDDEVSEEYCADGFIPAEQDPDTGKYTVKQGAYVAQIVRNGSVVGKYETLAEAVTAAQTGDTIQLLTDVTGPFVLGKSASITLDLNGKTLSVESGNAISVTAGELTVTSVVDDDGYAVGGVVGAIAVSEGAALNIQGGIYDVDWDDCNIEGTIAVSSVNSFYEWDPTEVEAASAVFTSPVPYEYCADGFIPGAYDDIYIDDEFYYYVKEGVFLWKITDADGKVAYSEDTPYADDDEEYWDWDWFGEHEMNRNGFTMTLLHDVAADDDFSAYVSGLTYTVDLGGYTVNRQMGFGVGACDVTIMNGVISNAGGTAISIANGAQVTLGDNLVISQSTTGVNVEGGTEAGAYSKLTVTDGAVINGTYGVLVFGSGSENPVTEVVVEGGTITGTTYGISGNGTIEGDVDYSNTRITISGGTVTGGIAGIYHPQAGALNMSSGTVSGGMAIYAKSGTISVTGGELSANGASGQYDESYAGSGPQQIGDALALDSVNYPGGNPTATISGGTFSSVNGEGVASYAATGETAESGFVSGGIFSSEVPEEYCADGYIPREGVIVNIGGVDYYTVKTGAYVAQIVRGGSVLAKYESFAEALEDAQSGDTVQLLDDITGVTDTFELRSKNLTIDGDEHKITAGVNADPRSVFSAWGGARNMFVIHSGNVTFENITLDGGETHYYTFLVQAKNGTTTFEDVALLHGGEADSSGTAGVGYGAAVQVDGANVLVNGDFRADTYGGEEDGGIFPFTALLYQTGSVQFDDSVNVNIGKDLLLVGMMGALDVSTPEDKAQVQEMLDAMNVPDGFAPYTLSLGDNGATSFTGASPLAWNDIIDYGKDIMDVSASLGLEMDKTTTPVEVGLLEDTVLPDTFTYEDSNFTINGNGNALSGTIEYTDDAGTLENVVMGTEQAPLVLDMTGLSEGKSMDLGSGITAENVTIKVTEEQVATMGATIVTWNTEGQSEGQGGGEATPFESGITVTVVDKETGEPVTEPGTDTPVEASLVWDDEYGRAYVGPCEARLTGPTHADPIYTSLAHAIELAAQSGDTVTLMMDIANFTGTQEISKSLTLDGAGHTISAAPVPADGHRNMFQAWGGSANMFKIMTGAVTFKNITLDGDVTHRYTFLISADNGSASITTENVTLLHGGEQSVDSDGVTLTPGNGYGAAIHLHHGAKLTVKDGFYACTGIRENNVATGVFPFTAILPEGLDEGTSVQFDLTSDNDANPTVGIGEDLLLVGMIGAFDVSTPEDKAAVQDILDWMKVPTRFIPYTLKLNEGDVYSFSGASPRTWNEIIDYGKDIMEVATANGFDGLDTDATPVEVGLLVDTVLPDTFTFEDSNFTVNGNGNALSGTIVFTDNAGTIENIDLGKDGADNQLVLDLRQVTDPVVLGNSVAAVNVKVLLTDEQSVLGHPIFTWEGDEPEGTENVVIEVYDTAQAEEPVSGEPVGLIWDDELDIAYIGPCEARLTGPTHENPIYTSLADAISRAAASGDTVTLMSDVTIASQTGVTIPAGKDIVLNLNGKTLENTVTANATSQVIVNNGTLTIRDSSNPSTGKIANHLADGVVGGNWPGHNYSTSVINNKGALTIESGTIDQTAEGNLCYAVDSTGSVTMTGGTVRSASNGCGMRMLCNSTSSTSSVTISGGTVEARWGVYVQNPSAGTANLGNLSITGGTFNCNRDCVTVDSESDWTSGIDIAVSGGTFNLSGNDARSVINLGVSTLGVSTQLSGITVSGGTFNYPSTVEIFNFSDEKNIPKAISGGNFSSAVPEEYCASGYIPTAQDPGTGMYTVKQGAYVAQIVSGVTTNKYETLAAAVADAAEGATVQLLADIAYGTDKEVEVWTKAVNLDLCGFTLTTMSEVSATADNNGYKAAAVCYSIPAAGGVKKVTVSNGTIVTAYGAGVYADDPGLELTLSNLTVRAATVGTQTTKEYSSAVRITGNAKVVIESGSYSGANAISVSNSGGRYVINGGEFTGDLFISSYQNTGVDQTVTITGGKFAGNFDNVGNGEFVISGGVFAREPAASYAATGYVVVPNTDAETKDAYPYTVAEVLSADIVYPAGEAAGVPIPLAWATNKTSAVSEGAPVTAADVPGIIDALGQNGANGIPVWQSYVLGLDPKSATATLRLAATPVASDATKVTVTGVIDTTKFPTIAGTTVTFRLASRNADGTWTDIQTGSETPSFEVSLDTVVGKVLAVFADIATAQ